MEKCKLSTIKLIALDLDGTFLNQDSIISEKNRDAVRRAADAGIEIVISTGRPYAGVLPVRIDDLPIRYCITTNGAAVYEYKPKKAIYTQCMENEKIAEVCTFLMTKHTHFDVFIDGDGFSDVSKAPVIPELDMPNELRNYLKDTRKQVTDIASCVRKNPSPVQKVTMNFPLAVTETDRKAVAEFLSADPYFRMVSGGYNNLEITRSDVSKSRALYWLADHLGIPREATCAIGDSENDRDIIEAAGLGVAMGNAVDEVKAAADLVIEDNVHDGVALFIDRVLSEK